MESVWWVFKQLFDKGMVYRGFKVCVIIYWAIILDNFKAIYTVVQSSWMNDILTGSSLFRYLFVDKGNCKQIEYGIAKKSVDYSVFAAVFIHVAKIHIKSARHLIYTMIEDSYKE